MDYDEGRKVYHLHMANTFSKTEYHLSINKELFDEMLKNKHTYNSKNLAYNEVILEDDATR